MPRCAAITVAILALYVTAAAGQVKVRLFASQMPEFAVFTVAAGQYRLARSKSIGITLNRNDMLVISKYNGRIAVKTRHAEGFAVDTVILAATSDSASFTMRTGAQTGGVQQYTGSLRCWHDMDAMIMVNTCPVDDYIAGTVRTEGGPGRHSEFIKTQAIITRTYLYRYFDRHSRDGYNVCDNTHCQAFHGITADAAIHRATAQTGGMVITGADSALIISAFHSNCGGTTARSEDVWVSHVPYLRSVSDPWCTSSRNAVWERRFTLAQWVGYLQREGYGGQTADAHVFDFSPHERAVKYTAAGFSIPCETMRQHLRLRSAYFTVETTHDTVILKGRGYGHGVGLCQEGAMQMAAAGKQAGEIISFYYTGAKITSLDTPTPLKVAYSTKQK